jgi:hypothetical protein
MSAENQAESGRKTQFDIYVERQSPEPRSRWRHAQVEKAGERCTFADYERAIADLGLSPDEVTVGSGWISWHSPETADEVQCRIEGAQEGARKHLAAIKEMYDTYTQRGLYEPSTPPGGLRG